MQKEVKRIWIYLRIPYLLACLLVLLGLLQVLLGATLSLSSGLSDGNSKIVEKPVIEKLTTSKGGRIDKTKI